LRHLIKRIAIFVGDQMGHIGEKLRELLENPELRDALADVFYTGIESPAQFEKISLADHIRHARGIDVAETPFDNLPNELEEVLQSFVIDRLPQPPPITLDDLKSLVFSHLAGIDLSQASADANIVNAYRRFVTCAALEIEQKRHHLGFVQHPLCEHWDLPEPGSSLAKSIRERYGGDPDDLPPSEYINANIWQSQSGFCLDCHIIGYFEDSYDRVYGEMWGYCTQRALEDAEAQMSEIIGSIAKSVFLCGPESNPPISFLVGGDGQQVLGACLDAIYQLSGGDKASILDRLRNAVILLSHADSAAADPIALSLSFSAIEALVCEKDEVPVNKQIKRHVSTLLVQRDDIETLKAERKAREKVLGQLYEVRSQVMHGNQVNASDLAAKCVRTIAAGVVRGVVSWMANQEKSGGDTSWKEFMDEINAAARKPDIVVGVPDLSELIPSKVPG
jgi:hypothetical protein